MFISILKMPFQPGEIHTQRKVVIKRFIDESESSLVLREIMNWCWLAGADLQDEVMFNSIVASVKLICPCPEVAKQSLTTTLPAPCLVISEIDLLYYLYARCDRINTCQNTFNLLVHRILDKIVCATSNVRFDCKRDTHF